MHEFIYCEAKLTALWNKAKLYLRYFTGPAMLGVLISRCSTY